MGYLDTTLLTLVLTILCLSSQSHAKSKFLTLPIQKDSKTILFYTSLGIGTPKHTFNLLIDLGGPILWYDCDNNYNSSTYHPVSCDSKQCSPASACTTSCNGPFKPGCTSNTCSANILNPFADAIFSGDTGEDLLFLSHSIFSGLLSGCTNSDAFSGEPSLLKDLPKSVTGVLGLARTQLALPTQLSSSHHNLDHKFSLCLPSSNKKGPGNLFIGGASHDHISSASSLLTSTPLIVNPVSTAPIYTVGDASYEYFIDVKSIKVGGEVVKVKSSLLAIDKKGNGGTKISTVNPFTVLHSSIYKPLVRSFVKAASDRKIKKVASVAPFGACFDFSTIGRTSITRILDVPTIDLVLLKGVKWTIYGGNSMVLVNKKVACLGFVDGGKEARTAVVIGGHQLEDNLLEFDLDSSKLSFSSSLLLHNARCSN